MPSALPDGEAAPADGSLPPSALAGLGDRPFGVYVHVPFCATRCGYCDFNTYTATELGGGASQASYASTAAAEVRLARRVLGDVDVSAATVFFGGGTPTLLDPGDLALLLRVVRDELGVRDDAEVTTEANPDSGDEADLAALRGARLRPQEARPRAGEAVRRRQSDRRLPARPSGAAGERRRHGSDAGAPGPGGSEPPGGAGVLVPTRT